jgi:hypothetical protein
MAEVTSKSSQHNSPNFGFKTCIYKCTSAANGDILTCTPEFLVVVGAIGFATDGTPGTYSITGTSTVITLTNGGTKTWFYLVWGY